MYVVKTIKDFISQEKNCVRLSFIWITEEKVKLIEWEHFE
mgnify:FL=1